MKIAFLADSFLEDESTGINGTQVQMYNLALAFKSRGLEVHYISLTRHWKRLDEIVDGTMIHWVQQGKSIFSWMRNIKDFNKILDRVQPDVLYQRGRSYLTYTAAKWAVKNGRQFVWGSNGEDSCDFWKGLRALRGSRRPLWKKIILTSYLVLNDTLIHNGIRNANHVINQTQYQKRRLFRNYGKRGIILPSYYPLSQPHCIQDRKQQCLWVANLSSNKQPEIFLKLAKHCISFKDWTFVLVGGTQDEKYWNFLVKEASALPNLIMTGAIPFEQTTLLFSKAALLINTSIVEGISNAMIEAWLHGVPVLSLNNDPNGWISKYNLGFCAKGNLESFLSHGFQILKDTKTLALTGDQCLDFAKKTFSSSYTIDRYLELFRDVK